MTQPLLEAPPSDRERRPLSPDTASRLWGLVFILGMGSVWMFCMVFVAPRPSRQLVALGLSIAAGAGAVLLTRWLRAAPPVIHSVTVMFSRMDGDDSFFVATCECGWTGEPVATEAECREEALEHSPNVQPETEYPLGR